MEDMDNVEKKVTQYLIPANVSTRFEFFEGFGWYELKIVAIACLIGAVIFFGLGLITKTTYIDPNTITVEMTVGEDPDELKPNSNGMIEKKEQVIPPLLRAFAIIIPGAGAFFLVKRDPSNGMSLINAVRSTRLFKKRQKLYLYKYGSGSEV